MPMPMHDGPPLGDDSKPPPASPGPPSHPSPRVRLEVELLTSGFASPPLTQAPQLADERERRAVLIVSRDPDLRRYLRECLLGEGALRLLEAGSASAALDIARTQTLHLVIADAAEQGVLHQLPEIPAIVAADVLVPGPGGGAPSLASRVALAPPFGAHTLQQHVRQLIG